MNRTFARWLLALAILAPVAVVGIGAVLDRPATGTTAPSREELERDAGFYRQSAGRQCGIDPGMLAHQETRDGEITWLSLQDGRTLGFTFVGRTGTVFCGVGR